MKTNEKLALLHLVFLDLILFWKFLVGSPDLNFAVMVVHMNAILDFLVNMASSIRVSYFLSIAIFIGPYPYARLPLSTWFMLVAICTGDRKETVICFCLSIFILLV